MAEIAFISQVALGVATPVQLSALFPGLKGGNAFAVKCVTGAMSLGIDNTVALNTGWPLASGEVMSVDAQSARRLWVIGGAADRIAVFTL